MPRPPLASFFALTLLLAHQPDGQAATPDSPRPTVDFAVREVPLGHALDGIKWESFVTSPDGGRTAYVTGKGPGLGDAALHMLFMGKAGTVRMVVDGQESREYVALSMPLFSPDGRRVAYGAQSGTRILDAVGRPLGRQQQFIVVDSVEGTPYDGVGPVVFSPDGRRVAHGAQRDKRTFIVLDGVDGPPHDGASQPVFSPDGSRIAYIAHDGKTSHLVDGETVTVVGHKATNVVRSPDGKRLAFLVEKAQEKWSVVLDGVEGATYVDVGSPVFSVDGQRVAYKASRGKKAWLVVIDGAEGKPWRELGQPTFSPDGRRVAYAVRHEKEQFVLVEGSEGRTPPRYRNVGAPRFSPDGRLAYLAHDGKGYRVVVDDVGGIPFDAIGAMAWGPDGRHLAWEARVGEQWHLVVDGVVGPEFGRLTNDLAPISGWKWKGFDDLWYVGRRGDAIVRWEVTLSSTTPVR